MEKKEIFFKRILEIEPKIERYLENIENKFKRFWFVKEKGIIKIIAVVFKKIFQIQIKFSVNTILGRKMNVYLADADASSLFFFGTLYGEELKITKFLVGNLKEDDVFYDVGANFGFYTLLAQELINPLKGEVHSFEPHPKIFKLLKENALLNKYHNTFLNNFALSDKSGISDFADREIYRHSGASSLVIDYLERFKVNYNLIKVKTFTLDEYIKDHKPPNIIKIDVEGGEYLVLKGGENLFINYNPVVIMEFVNDEYHQKAVNFLIEKGYKMYTLDKNGDLNLVKKEIIGKIFDNQIKVEANYVFLK